ncbi:hypothetical protein AB0B30_32660 [Streptomyces narbonensis]|uniref:Uncharacterized protein n=1 Tax=Streptomyces narbonensis TaxID=67333 RepID=A0ABV3CIU6_9ACTN
MSDRNVTMTAIDGTDALAAVIIRPGSTNGSVSIEAFANGMDKERAAYVLRYVADQFEAEAAAENPITPA